MAKEEKRVIEKISLPHDQASAARSCAQANGQTLSQFIEMALKEAIYQAALSKCAYAPLIPALTPAFKPSAVDQPENVRPFQIKPHLHAAAGSPILADVMDWEGDNDTVIIKINGLSMSPMLNDGDVIAMKHRKASRNPFMKKGLIYLVEYDGGFTVKRYNTRPAKAEEKGEEWIENGKVKVLESINPDFPEIIIKQSVEWIAWLDA